MSHLYSQSPSNSPYHQEKSQTLATAHRPPRPSFPQSLPCSVLSPTPSLSLNSGGTGLLRYRKYSLPSTFLHFLFLGHFSPDTVMIYSLISFRSFHKFRIHWGFPEHTTKSCNFLPTHSYLLCCFVALHCPHESYHACTVFLSALGRKFYQVRNIVFCLYCWNFSA